MAASLCSTWANPAGDGEPPVCGRRSHKRWVEGTSYFSLRARRWVGTQGRRLCRQQSGRPCRMATHSGSGCAPHNSHVNSDPAPCGFILFAMWNRGLAWSRPRPAVPVNADVTLPLDTPSSDVPASGKPSQSPVVEANRCLLRGERPWGGHRAPPLPFPCLL